MAKKPVNHDTNPQNTIETEALPSLKKNKVVNKILKAGKEERLKIIESDIIKNYAFWLDMRKSLMNDYFTNDKNEGELVNGTDKIFGKHKFKNDQLSKKKNTEGLNGVKLKKKSVNNTSRRPFPKTLEGLEKEFEELKGKTLSYHDKLRKKGLYSRIIKKKRKGERIKLKDINKNNLVGKKGDKIKIKPVKHIFNNEGKVVSSKFDFTDSETPKTVVINKKSSGNKVKLNQANKRLNSENNEFQNKKLKTEEIVKNSSMTSQETNFENKKQEFKSPFEPIFNKEDKMVFSKFEFNDETIKRNKNKRENNPKKVLGKLKERENNLKELEESGNVNKAKEIKEKDKWTAALKKSSGEKIKDDKELLKKSLRKEKNKKLKSKKKWEGRMANVQQSKQEKQQKRSANINARKSEKKKKKIKKAIKKGRYAPS